MKHMCTVMLGPTHNEGKGCFTKLGREVENQLRISITMIFARDRRAKAQWAYGAYNPLHMIFREDEVRVPKISKNIISDFVLSLGLSQ